MFHEVTIKTRGTLRYASLMPFDARYHDWLPIFCWASESAQFWSFGIPGTPSAPSLCPNAPHRCYHTQPTQLRGLCCPFSNKGSYKMASNRQSSLLIILSQSINVLFTTWQTRVDWSAPRLALLLSLYTHH